MAKLMQVKPVITQAKQKRKPKNNKSNETKIEATKNAVLEQKEDVKDKKKPVLKGEPKVTAAVSKAEKRKLKNKNVNKENEGDVDAAPRKKSKKERAPNTPSAELAGKYPLLKNDQLVSKFLKISISNNQKGRIRQSFRENFKGTSDDVLPGVIYGKIKLLAKDMNNISDGSLRKIRILYNMLRLASEKKGSGATKVENNNAKKAKVVQNGDSKENGATANVEVTDTSDDKKPKQKKKDKTEEPIDGNKINDKKVKGPKRYVVFVGNLPLDIERENIMEHFSDLNDHIVDVRVPKPAEGKKSAIAYVELKNEPSYELALSKHHSMLKNRRINVMYSAQQNTKLSKTEIKGKAAKMAALQKSGTLVGSVPLNQKRSQRRAKAKKAQAKEAQE